MGTRFIFHPRINEPRLTLGKNRRWLSYNLNLRRLRISGLDVICGSFWRPYSITLPPQSLRSSFAFPFFFFFFFFNSEQVDTFIIKSTSLQRARCEQKLLETRERTRGAPPLLGFLKYMRIRKTKAFVSRERRLGKPLSIKAFLSRRSRAYNFGFLNSATPLFVNTSVNLEHPLEIHAPNRFKNLNWPNVSVLLFLSAWMSKFYKLKFLSTQIEIHNIIKVENSLIMLYALV